MFAWVLFFILFKTPEHMFSPPPSNMSFLTIMQEGSPLSCVNRIRIYFSRCLWLTELNSFLLRRWLSEWFVWLEANDFLPCCRCATGWRLLLRVRHWGSWWSPVRRCRTPSRWWCRSIIWSHKRPWSPWWVWNGLRCTTFCQIKVIDWRFERFLTTWLMQPWGYTLLN